MNLANILANYSRGQQINAPIQEAQQRTAMMQEQMRQAREEQQSQALVASLLPQMFAGQPSMQSSGGAGPGITPLPGSPGGTAPPMGMGPPPSPGGAGPQMPPPGGARPQMPQAPIAMPPSQSGVPNIANIMSMFQKGAPGGQAAPGVQYGAMKDAMALLNPYEKAQMQMEMMQQKYQNQADMLNEKIKSLSDLTNSKLEVQKRGQDIGLEKTKTSVAGAADRQATSEAGKETRQNERSDRDLSKADSMSLQGELTRISSRMNTLAANGGVSTDEYKNLGEQWDAAKKEIDSRRSKLGYGPTSHTKPTSPNATGAASAIPAGAPTATDAKGNKVYYNGTTWIPITGS